MSERKPAAASPGRSSSRRTIVLTVLVTLAIIAAIVFALLNTRGSRRWVTNKLVVRQEAPPVGHSFDLRQVLLTERERAMGAGDLTAAARLSGELSHEALLRALAVHRAWLDRRHPQTKLYAQNANEPEWNYRNTAADFFAFHLHAGLLLNPTAMPSLNETLEAEAKLRTPEGLCLPVLATTGEAVEVDHDELLFASSEYAKDGLLSIYERHGGELVGPRMLAIVDAIIAESRQESRFGKIPGKGAEINGNLLQLCGRLSYAEGRADYAEFAARIADAMIQQSMAANHGLPPKFFDYADNSVEDETLKLKDHGNEAVLGLSEAYAMAVDRSSETPWRERADRWEEPIARMFELILKHGVNDAGLLVTTMQPSPPQPTDDELCDNWGYILSGAILFTDAAKRYGRLDPARITAIESRVDAVARASFARPLGEPWGDTMDMDSEADALESGIYMAAYRPALREEALEWTDRQIVALFNKQKRDGTAVGAYLDGNFIRTSLLYADIHSAGWRVEPWREDVMIGAASDGRGNTVISIRCTQPYSGTLRAPKARHQSIMKLPWNWARLNSWPEWNVIDGSDKVTGATGLGDRSISVEAIQSGLPLELPAFGEASVSLSSAPPAKPGSAGAENVPCDTGVSPVLAPLSRAKRPCHNTSPEIRITPANPS